MAKTRYNKLELTWIGKEEVPRLEPRILLEQPEKSYAAPLRGAGPTFYDNMLIHGDNLLALKALEAEYAGRVRCVYIDPPYNTGSAFTHYDDGIEHSVWLNLMRPRLMLLRQLLRKDGSIWVSADDHEGHYLKVLLDEVFGRQNFVDTVIWQKIYTTKNSARFFSGMHDYVFVYAKEIEALRLSRLPRSEKQDGAYKNPDGDSRGPWKATPIHARNYYSLGRYPITTPSGRRIDGPPSGTYWRVSSGNFDQMVRDKRIWWGKAGSGIPAQKRFLSDVQGGVIPSTLWLHEDAGHNGEAKNDLRALLPDLDDLFLTPKPERLLYRILAIATEPGDLTLDSFGGSGTTAAVAHKMGRRWITIELGSHCQTHVRPRIQKVVAGADAGGVTEITGWQGGGGFRYFELAPSLLERDRWGNWVISKQYNPAMLAEAMCKHEGFTYQPSASIWWQHGSSTERDFIYVTTQTLTQAQLQALAVEVGDHRSLLICCGAFKAKADDFINLTVKKIPNAVLDKCEWGKDDYSLKVAALQAEEPISTEPEPAGATPDAAVTRRARARKRAAVSMQDLPLFKGVKL